jgi:hypothetical protein
MIRRVVYTIGMAILSGCSLNRSILLEMTHSDVVLFEETDLSARHIKPIIFSCGELSVEISETRRPVKLIVDVNQSQKPITLWRDYDYSGILKISRSADCSKVRVLHWKQLILNRTYITQFDLYTRKKKKFRVPNDARPKITPGSGRNDTGS